MTTAADRYDRTLSEIDARLGSLGIGAPASSGEGAWERRALEAEVAALHQDKETLLAHYRHRSRIVGSGDPVFCAECEQPMPCETARSLFAKYDG